MTDKLGIALGVDTSGLKQGTKELDKFAGAADKAGNAADDFGREVKGASAGADALGGKVLPKVNNQLPQATRKFGMAKNGVQQLGFQIQDIAVQLQGGTSPFVALGQQGSQMAGIFGPGGAVLGAVIAIGSAISGTLVGSLMSATEQTDDLTDAVANLRAELNKTTSSQISKALIKDTSKIEDAIDGMTSKSRDVREASEEILEELTGLEAGFFGVSSGELVQAARARLRDNAQLLNQQAEIVRTAREKAELEAFEARTGLKGFETPVNQDVLGYNVNDYLKELEDQAAREVLINDRMNEKKRRSDEKLAEDKKRVQALELSTTANLFGNLAEIAAAGGEESFTMYKRMAQAQAGVSAGLAILNALAAPTGNPILNGAMAVSIGVLAGVQIAQIEQQTYSGARAMGGSVAGGNSYLVGEMGPEIITMGAQGGFVTPNHKLGGGESVTIVNQIGNGVRGNVRAEVAAMGPQITAMVMQGMKGARR